MSEWLDVAFGVVMFGLLCGVVAIAVLASRQTTAMREACESVGGEAQVFDRPPTVLCFKGGLLIHPEPPQ